VFITPNQAHSARIAVICGRKVSGKAVDRNRLKRISRAFFEERLRADALPSADYLVVLRPAAKDHEAALRSDLAKLLAAAPTFQ